MTKPLATNPAVPSPASANTPATAATPTSQVTTAQQVTTQAGTSTVPTPNVRIPHTSPPLLMDYIIDSLSFEGRLRFRATSRQYHTRLTPTICPVVVSVDGHEGPNGESRDFHHDESPRPVVGELPPAFANVNYHHLPVRYTRRPQFWPMEPTVHTVVRAGNTACADPLRILSNVTNVVDFVDLVRPRTQHKMFAHQRYVIPRKTRSYTFHAKWRHDKTNNSGHLQGIDFEHTHNVLKWTLVLHPVDPVVPGPTDEAVQDTWSADTISPDDYHSPDDDADGPSDDEYESDGPYGISGYGCSSSIDVPKFIRPFLDAFTKGNPHARLTVVGAERVRAEHLGVHWFDVYDLILNIVYFTADPVRLLQCDWDKGITFKTFDEWHEGLSAMDKMRTEWPTAHGKYECTRCHEEVEVERHCDCPEQDAGAAEDDGGWGLS
ncbi:uncharacterized protein LOC62_04G005236 [Vanrija pseudolonga]|uniref:Uncharacterized protein n=1 Tax=Vanrija pseudolonga TaxID=143232 RepID=A0AAF1BHZ6_9TREE|nr:hypothetical protein LOC62_04G005236 [Vanrija pseudolonga]